MAFASMPTLHLLSLTDCHLITNQHLYKFFSRLWDLRAFAWENEDRSTLVHTFFVDHTDIIPICSPGRMVRIYSDFGHWQQKLKQAWRDKVREGSDLEFLVVSPTPSLLEAEVAACVLLVQSPRADIVSVVVSVFEGEFRPFQLRARITVTVWTKYLFGTYFDFHWLL